MKFALLYFWDPAQAGPAEGEFSDWLALDAEIKESGAPVQHLPAAGRRARRWGCPSCVAKQVRADRSGIEK